MGCRVVADGMPLRHHAFNKFGGGVQIILDEEKGRFRVVLFQCVQNRRGIAVFKARVKGQVQRFAVFGGGIPHVIRIKLF